MRGENPEIPPTDEELNALYDASIAFRQLAPWEWMQEFDLFGVQNPESGEIGYCCILGGLGEVFALAVYEGSAGLQGLWEMREGDEISSPIQMLVLQKCLMASYEDRSQMDKRDLDQVKALGRKFRGRNAWPMFRSYLPGYQPWYLTGPQARFLTIALQQAAEVAARRRDNPDLIPDNGPEGPYLVRVQRPDGAWHDTRARRKPLPAPRTRIAPLDAADATRARELKSLPKSGMALEMDFDYMPGAIRGENGGRPYFPYLIMAADPKSGAILHFDVVKPDDIAGALPKALLAVIAGMGALPTRISVASERAQSLLEPAAVLLGVRITRVRALPALAEAREGLSAYMGLAPMPF